MNEKIADCIGLDGLFEWMASQSTGMMLIFDKKQWVCRWSSVYTERTVIGKHDILHDAIQEALSKSGLFAVYKDEEYFEIYKRNEP